MENIKKYIAAVTRIQLLTLFTFFIAGNALSQNATMEDSVINVCGSSPQTEKWPQSISRLSVAKGCATIIRPGSSTVSFAARDEIVFYPGFTAMSGSNFVAYLEPASFTKISAEQRPVMNNAEKYFVSTHQRVNSGRYLSV